MSNEKLDTITVRENTPGTFEILVVLDDNRFKSISITKGASKEYIARSLRILANNIQDIR